MTQPEALRLADALRDGVSYDEEEIESELRRLHAENQRCRNVCDAISEGWRADAEEWKDQRDALLEAFSLLHVECHQLHHNFKDRHTMLEPCPVVARINAAIKKAEENT